MNKEFGTGTGGSNKVFAERAMRDERIKDVPVHGGKLWVLRSDKMTSGMQDKKPAEDQN